MKAILDHLRSLFRRLLELRDTPHAIAGGVAIGMFFGFTPLFGVKTLLCLGTAWVARCSKIAAVITVSLHDIVTPFWPVLLRLEYDMGFWLLNHPHRFPQSLSVHHIKLGEMLHWTTFLDVGLPLLIGSMAFSIPAAAIAYLLTYTFLIRRNSSQLPSGA